MQCIPVFTQSISTHISSLCIKTSEVVGADAWPRSGDTTDAKQLKQSLMQDQEKSHRGGENFEESDIDQNDWPVLKDLSDTISGRNRQRCQMVKKPKNLKKRGKKVQMGLRSEQQSCSALGKTTATGEKKDEVALDTRAAQKNTPRLNDLD